MTTPQLKEIDYLKAWALFWVLATFGGLVLGAVAGGILGAILGAAGLQIQTIKIICGVFGFLLGIPLSYVLFRWSIAKFIVPKITAQNDSIPPIPAA